MNTIKVNNKEYPFKLTLSALMQFEDYFEKSFSKIDEEMRVKEMVYLLWAGLKAGAKIEKKEFDMSLEDLGDFMDMTEINSAMEKAMNDIAGPK